MDKYEIIAKTLEKENALIIEKYTKLEQKHNQLKELHEETVIERNNIREQLDSILYSRSYRTIKKIKKILGR